ncbi:MAG: hypothetical protein ACOCU7_02730 [Tangfeifania sp.]
MSNEMSMVAISHKNSENESERNYFEKGMHAEAEWTLGEILWDWLNSQK